MKLRNKKTGEIGELHFIEDKEYHFTVSPEDPADMCIYKKLADISKEWEDYEEPKEYHWIDYDGKVKSFIDLYEWQDKMKAIGNYFETREEAEKAVEKLKAWKRLKDKGFRFDCYTRRSDWAGLSEVKALENLIDITVYLPKDKIKEMEADLDLLFGGEE